IMGKLCRVCLGSSKNMVNIFEGTGRQDLGTSIAYMISEVTCCKIGKGDSFPKSICPTCLEDAQSAFDIIKTYERSYRTFCEVKDAILEDELLEDDVNQIIPSNNSDNTISVKVTQKINKKKMNGIGNKREKKLQSIPFENGECDQSQEDSNNKDYVHSKKSHECSQCKRSYQTPSLLKRHIMRFHNDERPFKCSHCPKSFGDNYTLKMHIRTHTGEKPFKCSRCPMAFTKDSGLRKHFSHHT
ncbi:hypothetical protein KR084_010334, partial [Drosophila pseudotakahashii]